ncbi:ferredoxin [Streptomyces triticagri]|uniref:Ferredoxin n=1 Tax=Streptomyces triticagri TaxID=2293568 RepID=A0A372M5E6_9ACTN|nr:ferredoxin [Streptomyces triticagri]RFU86156.1 ferredoxin [Streptomyces triticagri]
MGDRWQVEVDRGVCIGSGLCVNTAPDAFALDTARQSRPKDAEPDASEEILEAAEGCPVEAIQIALLGSGEQVFPPED